MTDDIDPFASLSSLPEASARPAVARTPQADLPPDVLAKVEVCAPHPLNGTGNALRFWAHFGEDVMIVPRVGAFTWGGQRWEPDPDGMALKRMAQAMGPLIEAEARFLVAPDDRAGLIAARDDVELEIAGLERLKPSSRSEEQAARLADLRRQLAEIMASLKAVQDAIGQRMTFAKTSGNADRMKNMVGESAPHLARALQDLDAGAFEVNTASGLLRFSVEQDGDFRDAWVDVIPHARDQWQTKIISHAYDPDAEAPLFRAFLNRIMPAQDMRLFLQRWFGLCMTAHTGEQKLCYFYGTGANGKSVLVDLIAWLLADYAAIAKIESLTGANRRGGGDATPDLVQLVGARFVRASEPDEGVRWQEGLIKELTGGENMLVRALQQDFFEFTPCFKLTISGNHKPDIRGTDDGIWRRLLLVPFDQTIPPAERDANLQAKLRQEAPGILRWLVDGLKQYLEIGLAPPASVTAATDEFRAESDPVGQFLTDCTVCSGNPDERISSADLTHAMMFWQIENAMPVWGAGTIQKRVSNDKAGKWRHPVSGQGFVKAKSAGNMVYTGIRLGDTFAARFRAAPRDQSGRPLAPRADSWSGGGAD